MQLSDVTVDMLGTAKSVKVTKDSTTIVDGAGDKDQIADRIKAIEAQIEDTTSDFDREKLQERKAKLSGGVAVIKVGAATEAELKETKSRIDDALQATHAAVEEGIVAGGGVCPDRRHARTRRHRGRRRGGEGRYQHRPQGVRGPDSRHRRELRLRGLRRCRQDQELRDGLRPERGHGRIRRHDRAWASSTRSRSSAPRCKTPRPLRRCSSSPRRLSPTFRPTAPIRLPWQRPCRVPAA